MIDLIPTVPTHPGQHLDRPRPSRLRAIAVRFALVYSVLFFLPILALLVWGLSWTSALITPVWRAAITWVARSVLGISHDLTWFSGSGDKTVDWIWLICCAAVALVSAVAWSFIERTRAHEPRIRDLLRVVIRYCLAFVMLRYGVSKLFVSQFPAPTISRLLQPYGESSPMGLLWTFMGASPAYVFFSGAAETVGALLLLSRRTTTLGALVLGVVLANVVMMNFCYDVPVKIDSSHYLAMCGFLIAPDAAGLVNFLVFRRPAQPVDHAFVPRTAWMRWARRVLKYGVSGYVIIAAFSHYTTQALEREPDAWYEGYWKVTAFTRDGHDVPALVTDATRWDRIRFQTVAPTRYVRWRFMDGSPGALYTFAIDENSRTMTLAPAAETEAVKPMQEAPPTLRYARQDADRLTLEGRVGESTLAIQLQRLELRNTLLMSRGFHWITEESFNR